MSTEDLIVVAVDCETWLSDMTHPKYGYMGAHPLPVCWSVQREGKPAMLIEQKKAIPLIRALFKNPRTLLVFHHLGFDVPLAMKWCGVPAKHVYKKLDSGRIRDTYVREKLIATATGDIRKGGHLFDLASCLKRYIGVDKRHLKKGDDVWRTRYHELDGLPVSEYPKEAYDYAAGDAVDTLTVFEEQEAHISLFENDEHFQTQTNFVCGMVGGMSPYVDKETVDLFADKHTAIVERVQKPFIKAGFLRWNKRRYHQQYPAGDPRREGWSEVQSKFAEAIDQDYRRQNKATPRTERSKKYPIGKIKQNKDTLLGCASKALRLYGRTAQDIKLVNAFVPALKKAAGHRVAPSYNFLVSTGRMSCRKPNQQQLPRAAGARECFKAGTGRIIVCIDFDSFEMFGLAQILLWEFNETKLLDTLNANQDPHLKMTATLLRTEYKEVVDMYHAKDKRVSDVRQLSKIVNFGAAGGMGADTFLQEHISEDLRGVMSDLNPHAPLSQVMRDILDDWKETWGMRQYFQWVSKKTRGGRKFTYTHPWSGRIRGGVGYTDGCNLPFQGICADAYKAQSINVMRELLSTGTYLNEKQIELGAMLHDENLLMGPPDTVRKWATRVQSMMCDSAKQVMPDCKIRAGAEVTGTRWRKAGVSIDKFEHMERIGVDCDDYLDARNLNGKLTIEQYAASI